MGLGKSREVERQKIYPEALPVFTTKDFSLGTNFPYGLEVPPMSGNEVNPCYFTLLEHATA